MKNFISFMIKFITLCTVLAAFAYWINYFLKASGKAELLAEAARKIFQKKQSAEAIEPIAIPSQSTCNCNNAVCAVDMCMPY